MNDFFNQKEGHKRCPAASCKNPEIPEDFEIKTSSDADEAVRKHSAFRTLLNTCFMDAIDKFCFTSTEEPPERKVLDAFVEFVIVKKLDGEKSGTKELSPFNKHGIDFSPVVRSFLLQFCLQCDEKPTQEHVETFMLHKK